MEILAAIAFVIHSTTTMQKVHSSCKLVFGRDIILPKKDKVDWELIDQKKKAQTNKDNIRKIRYRVDYDYKLGDNAILTKHTAKKCETPYMGSFFITKCFTNGTVKLKMVQHKLHIIYITLSHINMILKLKILFQKYVW